MNKIEKTFVVLCAALFALLLIILCYNSRIAIDDFYFLGLTNKYGWWDGMIYMYTHWSGRWSAHILAGIFLQYMPLNMACSVFSTITFVGFWLTINHYSKLLSDKKPDQFLISVLITAASFFGALDIAQGWFWLIAVAGYLWSSIAFLILINCIFIEKKNKLTFPLIILLSLFIGGAAENLAISSVIIIIAIAVIFKPAGKRNELFLALFFISASLMISYLAEGTRIRKTALPAPDFFYNFIQIFIGFAYLIKGIISKIPLYFIFLFPVTILSSAKITPLLRSNFRKLTLVYFIAIVSILNIVFIMSERGPDRALNVISVFTALYFTIIVVAYSSRLNVNQKNILTIFASGLATIFLFFTLVNQYQKTTIYSHKYDQLITTITKSKTTFKGSTFFIEPLPNSGFLSYQSFSSDTNYFTNQHFRFGLDLPFAVASKND